jgi:periplasmic protein TonB
MKLIFEKLISIRDFTTRMPLRWRTLAVVALGHIALGAVLLTTVVRPHQLKAIPIMAAILMEGLTLQKPTLIKPTPSSSSKMVEAKHPEMQSEVRPPPETDMSKAVIITSSPSLATPNNVGATSPATTTSNMAPTTTRQGPPVSVAAKIDSTQCQKPQYPSASVRLGEEGTVSLQFLIGEDGRVTRPAEIKKSSGYKRLDEAAKDALSLCRFRPPVVDGKPVQSLQVLSYRWELNEE